MVHPHLLSPQKGRLAGDDNANMMLAVAPGCTSAASHMSSFTATSMEQDNETDWDSESDKPPQQEYHLAGMSDYEDWVEDNVDMEDHPSCADEPPTVSDKHTEGASGIVEVLTIATHPPDPTHFSTLESSPHTEDSEDANRPVSQGNVTNETPSGDIIVEEEYYEQQEEEELDYEDDASVEECEQDVKDVKESETAAVTEEKEPTIWKRLGDPVDERASTDTNTGEAVSLMESVLGILSPEGGHRDSKGYRPPHSRCSDHQHTVLSDDS